MERGLSHMLTVPLVINTTNRRCDICKTEHAVNTIITMDSTLYKGILISYDAIYLYCSYTDMCSTDVWMAHHNQKQQEKAYILNRP